jgi:hypothetical protein
MDAEKEKMVYCEYIYRNEEVEEKAQYPRFPKEEQDQ